MEELRMNLKLGRIGMKVMGLKFALSTHCFTPLWIGNKWNYLQTESVLPMVVTGKLSVILSTYEIFFNLFTSLLLLRNGNKQVAWRASQFSPVQIGILVLWQFPLYYGVENN